jgi:hypothetical protein
MDLPIPLHRNLRQVEAARNKSHTEKGVEFRDHSHKLGTGEWLPPQQKAHLSKSYPTGLM